MAAEHIRHWRVGDVDIARIVEVYGFVDDISMLLPDATPQYVQQFGWLLPHFATPDGRMIISFQCFVLRSKGRTAMIDTCIGNDRKREYDVFCNMRNTFLEDLTTAGFPADAVPTVTVHRCDVAQTVVDAPNLANLRLNGQGHVVTAGGQRPLFTSAGRRGIWRAPPPRSRSCCPTGCGCSARTTRTPFAPGTTSPDRGGRRGIRRPPPPRSRSC